MDLPPTSALRGHPLSVAPWRRHPEARDTNGAHSQGQRLPYRPESSIIRSDALVDPPARRTRPRLDISGHPHHWFRMRAEWQEERFCAMIKLLLPFHCPIPVWSIDSFCSTELYAQNADDFAGRNSPSEDQLTATGILYT